MVAALRKPLSSPVPPGQSSSSEAWPSTHTAQLVDAQPSTPDINSLGCGETSAEETVLLPACGSGGGGLLQMCSGQLRNAAS